MAHTAADERMLIGLHAARRNRYYYGKMLDVFHLSMEQRYGLSKQWLFNRAVVGPGVICGLTVEPVSTADGNGILIRSGLAFDGWGREIIVPADITMVPLALTDPCGAPTTQSLPANVTVQICYSECDTDFAPALVNDPSCGCGDDCEAGTVVETFCLKVLTGTALPVTEPCLDAVKKGLDAGDLHGVLCELSKQCVPDPDDPCLTLANIAVAGNGTLTVDSCGPRVIAPTNRILAQLVRCLADCCADGTPPPPTQPTDNLLRIVDVRALYTQENPTTTAPQLLGRLNPPDSQITVVTDDVAVPDIIEIVFDPAVPWDPTSAVLKQSVKIGPSSNADKLFPIGNVLRIYRPKGFRMFPDPGKFVIVGGPNSTAPSTPAITALNGTRLDGDYPQSTAALPSGDGTQGGDFAFTLLVSFK